MNKVTMSIEIDAEFRDWLGKFCTETKMAMDKALIVLALYGLDHLRDCKAMRIPTDYRRALAEPQEKGEQR